MRNREVQIKFYATEKERESIRRNAKRAGMKMGEYARAVLTSDDVSIKVIDTEPLKKAAHELAKQGTNLNQFMKFLNMIAFLIIQNHLIITAFRYMI